MTQRSLESQKLAPLVNAPKRLVDPLSASAAFSISTQPFVSESIEKGSPTYDQLKQVRANLVGLPSVLKDEVQQRRYGDESRLLEVRDLALKVERHLALEIKRRTEADKALQQHVDKKMTEIQAKMEKASAERMHRMQEAVDVITKTIGDVRKELQEEHERTSKLALELRHQAEHSVSDLKAALEQEKVSRLEKEAQLQLKLAQDIMKTQENLEHEHKEREASVLQTRTEFMDIIKDRDKSDEHFRLKVMEDLSCLKTAIQVETETRESVEEHITQTIATVTEQIQTSLHTVVQG